MPVNDKPLISIVVLNWNGEEFIGDCLRSIENTSYPNFEIIVVDNASTDKSIELIQKYSKVKLIRNPENYGFALGNSIGIDNAQGKYVVTLNNDMVVDPTWLDDPVSIMEDNPQVGITGCRQMRFFEKDIIDGLYHAMRKDLGVTAVGNGESLSKHANSLIPGYVIGVSGGSAIFRKDLLDQIGGYDDTFFGYYEDIDLCFRAFLNGWKTVFVPTSVVYHRGSASFKKNIYSFHYLLDRNRLLFIYKNFSFKFLISHLPDLLIYELIRFKGMTFGLKYPLLYLQSRFGALKKINKLRGCRKKNSLLFNKLEREFTEISYKKIIPLKT